MNESDGEALLAAIIANPAEDDPRLRYADWLQERGEDERAEFIRVQCHPLIGNYFGHNYGTTGCSCEGCVLRVQAGGLFNSHWREWAGETLNQYFRVTVMRETFVSRRDRCALVVRGFVSEITCGSADWLTHGDAIRARHPVTLVRLTTWPTMREVDAWEIERFGQTYQFGFHDSARSMFRSRWPGVTFEIPA